MTFIINIIRNNTNHNTVCGYMDGYLVFFYCIMKKIDITGKRNQDKMKQIADPEAVIERKVAKNRGSADLPDGIYEPDQSLVLEMLKTSVADKSLGPSSSSSSCLLYTSDAADE